MRDIRDLILIAVIALLLGYVVLVASADAKVFERVEPSGKKVKGQTISQLAQLLKNRGHGNDWLQGIGQKSEQEIMDLLYEAMNADPRPKRGGK